MEIKITPTEKSRIGEVDFDKLEFGRIFSDHMFEMVWADGRWQNPRILPFGPISITPAMNVLHYGQSVFEGMKAYYADDNTVQLFRPKDHLERLNASASRICIPTLDYDLFIRGLEELLRLDAKWVPRQKGHALYVRPLIYASDDYIAAVESSRYHFYIITSPVGAYYKEGFNPVSLTTPDGYVRAVKGGTGEAKTGGNYAASFLPAREARKKGYTQVLWLDAIEHRYIEEVGTMNIFFRISDRLITPRLTGSVLSGVTRRSIIELAREKGIPVDERQISIDEVFEAGRNGTLQEVFGSGTAAVISPVKQIHHKGNTIQIGDGSIGPVSREMFDTITGIQNGELEDRYGWTHRIRVERTAGVESSG